MVQHADHHILWERRCGGDADASGVVAAIARGQRIGHALPGIGLPTGRDTVKGDIDVWQRIDRDGRQFIGWGVAIVYWFDRILRRIFGGIRIGSILDSITIGIGFAPGCWVASVTNAIGI